jgi:ABC-2 type transport system permease protein
MSWPRLVALHLRIAVLNELQYRTNLGLQLVQSLIALATSLISIAFVFSKTTNLAGWTASQILVVVGVYFLVGGLTQLVILPSLARFMEDVRLGSLDFALIKPVDSQLLMTARQVEAWKIIDVLIGIGVIAFALVQTGSSLGLARALTFVLVLLAGVVVVASFLTILATSAFWFVRVQNMLVIFQAMFEAGRWPITIYPPWLRLSLTFLVPVGFAITVPAEALVGAIGWRLVAVAVMLALVMPILARWLWQRGLRLYAGASA